MVRHGRGVQVLIKTGVSCRVKRWTRATYTIASGIELNTDSILLSTQIKLAGKLRVSKELIQGRWDEEELRPSVVFFFF